MRLIPLGRILSILFILSFSWLGISRAAAPVSVLVDPSTYVLIRPTAAQFAGANNLSGGGGGYIFTATDFNESGSTISLDYTNGQKATSLIPGFLSAADWVTFNAKAPTASPTFTGTPVAPTAAADTNTTQIATTAFVIGQGYLKSATAASTYQGLDSDLTTYSNITPSANVQSLLGAADYSAMRTQLSLVPGTNVQAYDADLTTYAGITPSANIQTFLGAADYAAMRTQLGLTVGTNVQAYDADLTTYAGITPSGNVQSLLGAADYSAMRTQLGLVIGTNVQAFDADLSALAGVTSAADKLPYFTGSGTAGVTDFTSFARTLLDDANAAAARVTLGLDNYTAHGNAGASEDFDWSVAWHSVTLDQNTTFTDSNAPSSGTPRSIVIEILQDNTGGRTIDWSAITSNAPTISSTANSVTIVQLSTRDGGTTVYATSTADTGGALIAANNLSDVANASTSRTNLGLAIGTNVQAYDSDLTTWAGVTPGTGVATALAVNIGSSGAVVTNGGALGTPSSGTLTNATGLPISTGVSGLGTGVATALATTANATGGVATVDGTKTLTNTTLDASATGNVLKQYGYLILTHPTVFGSGVTQQTTVTSPLYGQALFSNSADKATNYVEYICTVPRDIDTAVDLTAEFQFILGGADTGDHEYEISMVTVAASAPYDGAMGNAVSLTYTADNPGGADKDVQTAGAPDTLTDWKSNVTAGRYWRIRVARDGDNANDGSTVNSYSGPLVIRYGSTQ